MATREVEDIFTDIIERAKALDPVNSRKWFDKLAAVEMDGGALVIGCPDDATVQFLRDNCAETFTGAAQQITGHLITVEFKIKSGKVLIY